MGLAGDPYFNQRGGVADLCIILKWLITVCGALAMQLVLVMCWLHASSCCCCCHDQHQSRVYSSIVCALFVSCVSKEVFCCVVMK